MKKILIATMVLALSLLLFAPQSLAAESYSDITPSNSHYKTINYITEKHIMYGQFAGGTGDKIFYTAGTFAPNDTLYKNEAASYVVKAANLRYAEFTAPSYTDVTEKTFFYKDIAIATDKGFFKKSTTFQPDAYITREETAYMLAAAFQLTGTSKHKFADVSDSSSYNSAIQALVANGITAASDKFNPNQPITRAQFATFLARAMEPSFRVKATDTPTKATSQGGIGYKGGLVPTTLNSKYTFRERYESENNLHIFNKLTNKIAADKLSRKVTMRGYNKLTQTTSSIVYYEDAKRFKVTIDMPYTSGLVDMNYPIKAGATTTKYTEDTVNGGQIKHVFTAESTTATKTVEGKKYVNVIVIQHEFYFDGADYPMQAEYYFVKNIGLIAFNTEVGNFTLVPGK
ncbi:MAG: S-layer homology domain-containing protein [Solibacillus sp.]